MADAVDVTRYLEAQGVEQAMSEAVQRALLERPVNPIRRVGELLLKAAARRRTDWANFAKLSCLEATPTAYKLIATQPSGKLIKMSLPVGAADNPHGHPVHYMYVLTGARLAITHPMPDGTDRVDSVEMPPGAAIVLPEGPRQVKNIGNYDVEVLFVEPTGIKGSRVDCDVTPFQTNPEEYTIVAQDDAWLIGLCEIPPHASDAPHSRRDHMIYVLSGESVRIHPMSNRGGEYVAMPGKELTLPLHEGACLPVPAGHQCMENTGKETLRYVFWELKQ